MLLTILNRKKKEGRGTLLYELDHYSCCVIVSLHYWGHIHTFTLVMRASPYFCVAITVQLLL